MFFLCCIFLINATNPQLEDSKLIKMKEPMQNALIASTSVLDETTVENDFLMVEVSDANSSESFEEIPTIGPENNILADLSDENEINFERTLRSIQNIKIIAEPPFVDKQKLEAMERIVEQRKSSNDIGYLFLYEMDPFIIKRECIFVISIINSLTNIVRDVFENVISKTKQIEDIINFSCDIKTKYNDIFENMMQERRSLLFNRVLIDYRCLFISNDFSEHYGTSTIVSIVNKYFNKHFELIEITRVILNTLKLEDKPERKSLYEKALKDIEFVKSRKLVNE